MNLLTATEVSEYPYGLQAEIGYQYAEFHNTGGDNPDYYMRHLEEDIPGDWEPVSSPILTDAGWRVVARKKAPDCIDLLNDLHELAISASESTFLAEMEYGMGTQEEAGIVARRERRNADIDKAYELLFRELI